MSNKVVRDNFSMSDNRSGLWARTKIMVSHDDIEEDEHGISHFVRRVPTGISKTGETMFRKEIVEPEYVGHNMVTLGGCQLAMELLFGVKGPYNIPTMYNINQQGVTLTGVGVVDSSLPNTSTDPTYDVPSVEANGVLGGTSTAVIHRPGDFVQLFGIGSNGSGENDITIHPVSYRENHIEMNIMSTDNSRVVGKMIPFKISSSLSNEDKLKYFGKKKLNDNGNTYNYYLKRFENTPVIKHIWRTDDYNEPETEVSSEDVWRINLGSNIVESFTECVLKVTKNDAKDYFNTTATPERARINTIALFSGEYVAASGDYRDIRLFSKLNIPTEYLSLNKDLNIIYRVYTS